MQKGENETQKGERLKSMTGRKKAKAQRERERGGMGYSKCGGQIKM